MGHDDEPAALRVMLVVMYVPILIVLALTKWWEGSIQFMLRGK